MSHPARPFDASYGLKVRAEKPNAMPSFTTSTSFLVDWLAVAHSIYFDQFKCAHTSSRAEN
jgi:hypothetical protein